MLFFCERGSLMMKMTEEKALSYFGGGLDCSQVVFEYGAEKLGFDKETALKISAAFGGGMWAGERCGCVTGALMAIGLKYGQCKIGDEEAKGKLLAKKAEFEEAFKAAHESLICREILKHDLSTPEGMEKIMEEKLLETVCPCLAVTACDILDEIL